MFNTLQNINHRRRINDNDDYDNYDNNNNNYYQLNKLKNSENLYQNTYNPRRKLYIYTQPDSMPLNNTHRDKRIKYRNFSFDNESNKNGNNIYYGNRDNNQKNNNRYLRFNKGGYNRAMDILLGND